MRIVWHLTALSALSLLCATQTPAQANQGGPVLPDRIVERGTVLQKPILPSQFRDHWSESPEECGKDAVEDDQVWINDTSLNYYETAGHLTRIVLENERQAVVTVRSEGEVMVFVMKKGLILSLDGQSLTVRDEDDTGSSRFYRCRAKKP